MLLAAPCFSWRHCAIGRAALDDTGFMQKNIALSAFVLLSVLGLTALLIAGRLWLHLAVLGGTVRLIAQRVSDTEFGSVFVVVACTLGFRSLCSSGCSA